MRCTQSKINDKITAKKTRLNDGEKAENSRH